MNETHDPGLQSWVESANRPSTDFPIQNLPFGVYKKKVGGLLSHAGVAIGNQILDIKEARNEGLFSGLAEEAAEACADETLNRFMGLGPLHWSALRKRLSTLLSDASEKERTERCLVAMADVEMQMPATIGDYSDFYASIHHARNVGSMFRPDNPLMPNYKWVPIGYHGRASSIVVSGTSIKRPAGQTKSDADAAPTFGLSAQLDYELEVGLFVGQGNALGSPIAITEAEDHIFGFCLVNDWSARDIQKWEYQPLGPFLSKSFATTISPWIVTLEALEPFRCPSFSREEADPQPLDYLRSPQNAVRGGFDITLEVDLTSERMRVLDYSPVRLSRCSFSEMYWTAAQMLTHHTSNGCNVRPGDVLASGTVSGDEQDARGCLLELTSRGSKRLQLPTNQDRAFLEDGDEVILRGYCERMGARRIGFGACSGIVVG